MHKIGSGGHSPPFQGLLLNVATPIPLLFKEGRRVSAGVVIKVAKLPLKCREASAIQRGALREYLRGGCASILTTPSAFS